MGVAPVAVKHNEQDGAHDGVGTAASVASVVQWAFSWKVFPSPASLEELEKEDQLALASDGSLITSLGMKATTGSVHRPSLSRDSIGNFWLTIRMKLIRRRWLIHDVAIKSFIKIWRDIHFPL